MYCGEHQSLRCICGLGPDIYTTAVCVYVCVCVCVWMMQYPG